MVDCLLTILVNQICRLFSTHQTPDSIITLVETEETVGAVVSVLVVIIVKEVIVREPLKFVFDLLVFIVLETLIVQSAYVPSLRELKVMVLLPTTAMVVLEEHEPPKVMAPDWVELNV